MNTQYDIAIIGGGPVGASLALSLRDSNLKICVLESRPAGSPSHDARALALSYGSRLLLERLRIWRKIKNISAIRTIHISQKHSFGRAMLRAAELGVPELGYVMPYPALHGALDDALKQCAADVVYGASVSALAYHEDQAVIGYTSDDTEHTLHAKLAVVADGGRLLSGQYPPDVHDYGQTAVISHLTCSSPLPDTAFERFTPQGPVALLPYQDGYELVWTVPHQRAQELVTCDETAFLHELQQHFGDRVGKFLSVAKRTAFPLALKRAPNIFPLPHTVLLGNAAQTMHPVAGQGFNLGLRDAWELGQEILAAQPGSLGSLAMLEAYRSRRSTDREAGIRFTDSLVRLFSNDLPVLGTARAAALSILDCLPFAKKFVAKRMMFGANG